jgi:hypothetical protein
MAQIKDMTINADKVSLEKEKHRIEAEGSVEVNYKDILIRGGHMIYNTSEETFVVDKGFNLLYEGLTFEGESLYYELARKTGDALDFKFNYNGISLAGKNLNLQPDKYEIKSVNFTTCNLPDPHYHVTASDLVIYPEYQRMVAYWGFFWLGRFPIVPMPTYIYDLRADEKSRKNVPPFPEIGANSVDGTYINENLAWNLNKNVSGTYTLSYATNKGVGGGAQGDYTLDDRNSGNMRLYGNFTDGLYGGVTHNYSFGGEVGVSEAEKPVLFVFPRRRQFDLETTLSSRERINYQRVSFLPGLVFRSNHGVIVRNEAKYDLALCAGYLIEEGNTQLFRGGGSLKLFGDFQETAIGYITPTLNIDNLYYSSGTRWLNSTIGMDITKKFGDLLVRGGYIHYLYAYGQSPFIYEMYRFRAADRFLSDLIFSFGETRARISSSYFLDTLSPEDIDYTLFFKLHCYNLDLTYRSLRNEFAIGFSLAAR